MRWSFLFLLSTLFTSVQLNSQCSIFNVVVEAHPCVNGMFLVDIDFDVENPGGDQFGVLGNATNYGLFSYDSLPITLGPLPGDGVTEWEFIIYDLEEPSCQAVDVLGIINCCNIEVVTADPLECQGQFHYSLLLDLDTSNTSGVGFDVFDGDENFIGFWSYSDLPVTIPEFPASGNNIDIIIVCDNDNPLCCDTYEIDALDCDTTDCEIYDIVVDTSACEDGEFFVTINFSYENVSPLFNVVGNGNDYGNFEYNQLPITLGPFAGDGETIYEFGISDVFFEDCGAAIALDPVQCPEICGFLEVLVEPTECQGDSAYSLDLDFIPAFASDHFIVSTAGTVIDTYAYEALPLTIDSFPASGNFFDVLTVCDLQDTACCETIEFVALQCGSCLIYNLEAQLSACDSNMQFFIEISFAYTNVSDSFTVSGNGMTYGTFSYDSLPVTIGPLPADSTTIYEIAVIDNEDIFCFAGEEIGLVDCENICGYSEIIADPLECTGDNQYALFLDFEVDGTNQTHFDLYSNGEFVGFFAYDDLPVTILEFPSGGGDFDTVTICDNDNPGCCETIVVEALSCDIECNIFDLAVDLGQCHSDSTYTLFANFEHEGVTAGGFDVYGNGEYLGFFPLEPLPLVIENFPVNPEGGNSLITVCQSDDTLCCTSLEFEGLLCNDTCDIFDIVTDTGDCTTDSTFALFLDFEYTGVTNGAFDIYAGDDLVAFVDADSLPVMLENFPSPPGGIAVLTICENDNPECCTTIEFEAPVCSGACHIFEPVVDPLECTSDSTWAAIINFDWENVTAGAFDIWAGDTYLGEFPEDSIPVTVTNIPDPPGNFIAIKVCEAENPECCHIIEVEALSCGIDTCDITVLEVDFLECTGDTTYAAIVAIEWTGVTADGFDVWAGDHYLGFFPDNAFPVTITDIPAPTGGGVVDFTVCESDNMDCCATTEIEVPDCGPGECNIFELTANPTECTSDSIFGLLIDFEYENLGADGFDYYGDGEYLGFFPVNNIPDIISFPVSGNPVSVLTICASDDTLCCASVEFEPLICGNECSIVEVGVDPVECTSDSTYALWLNFDYSNTGSDSFDVFAGGNLITTIHGDSLPVLIENFPVSPGPIDVITVCVTGNAECCKTREFEGLNCGIGACEIGELNVDIGGCDEDSFFFVTIDFDYANVGNEGFNVSGNGMQYGNFNYEDLPIIIDSLEGDGETIYEFVVHDAMFGDCSSSIEIGTEDCDTTDCELGMLNVDIGDCDEDGYFFVTINFDYANVGNEGFTVVGNGNTYGSFSYEDLPIVIDSLEGDSMTLYEFGVFDNVFGDCANDIGIGIVDCDPTGVFDPGFEVLQLEIFYSNEATIVRIPEDCQLMRVYNTGGRLIMQQEGLSRDELVSFPVQAYPQAVYMVQLISEKHVYTGKMLLR